MGIVISALVTFWVGFLIYKKYKPQPVLFLGGMILMYIAVLCGYGTILPEKASTGSWFFDAFEFMRKTMSSNAAGLGLNIMSVGAFARYMDRIGASRSLVRLTIKPLLALKSPYLVLSGTWVVGMLIGLCINSASGLAMLLMVTMFPILIGLGVSRLAATAAVASTLCFDWSPSDTGTILSATTAGVDPVLYWTNYQVPIVMVAFVVVGALHYFTQKYMDKRMGHVVKPMEVEKAEENPADSAPLWYAVLPVIPLSLILSFSSLWITTIKMNIVMAMFIGLFIGACCEFARWRDGKKVFADIQTFFDGLGMQMANVITLIIAGLRPDGNDASNGCHYRIQLHRNGQRQRSVLCLCGTYPCCCGTYGPASCAHASADALCSIHCTYLLPDYGSYRCIFRHGQRFELRPC